MDNKKETELKDKLSNFLDEMEGFKDDNCYGDKQCLIKNNKGLVERVNKKMITDDGRELLF
jgi:hypothetical protein